MKKTVLFLLFVVVTVIGFYVYFTNKLPLGIEIKGHEGTVEIISLSSAIIGLAGAIISLITQIVEIRRKKSTEI